MKRSDCASRQSIYRDAKKLRESFFFNSNATPSCNIESERVDYQLVDLVKLCSKLDFSVDFDEDLELDDSKSFDSQELVVNDSCEFELETSFNYTSETDDQEESLENRLASITIKHHPSGAAVRSITDLLISLGHKIHKDRRTILKTPRKKLDSNSFQHFE